LDETSPVDKVARAAIPQSIIDQCQTAEIKSRLQVVSQRVARGSGVADFGDKDSDRPVRRRTGVDAVSAVKMSENLTAAIDAWAEAHQMVRSDAIRKLVELGLKAEPLVHAPHTHAATDSARIEQLAVKKIDELLDPSLPADERERRIRRLTEGPPEFSGERIDLPKPRT
jgi:hypothetical protein